MTAPTPPISLTPDVIAAIGDDNPWLGAYLRLREAVLGCDVGTTTEEEFGSYAAELRRQLPQGSPPAATLALIRADMQITFPLRTDALWTPEGAQRW